MNTNQDTTLKNQDAFEKWWYGTDANLILCSRNSANAGYQAATKASEQRIKELGAKIQQFIALTDDQETKMLELTASNNQLREALELARKEYERLPHSLGYEFTHLPIINKALSSTTAQSLAKHDNEVIERCAKVCEYYAVNTFNSSSRNAAIELAVAIRNIENEKLEGK